MRSAVAPFRGERELRRAIAALSAAGFPNAAITTFRAGSGRPQVSDALRDRLVGLPQAQAEQLARELAKGAALLFVRVQDASEEKRASLALLRHSRGSVQVHDFESR